MVGSKGVSLTNWVAKSSSNTNTVLMLYDYASILFETLRLEEVDGNTPSGTTYPRIVFRPQFLDNFSTVIIITTKDLETTGDFTLTIDVE